MKNKKVLITGSGTGIGLACAKKFLEEGWHVLAHYNTTARALQILRKTFKEQMAIVQADFSDNKQLLKFLNLLEKESFSALVNNAAVYDFSKDFKNRISFAERTLKVNAIAPVLIAEIVVKKMRRERRGHIVNISSIAAKYGSPSEHIFYGVSKRALEGATRTLARENASSNICVNTIRPGVFDTTFHAKIGKNLSKRISKIPAKKCGQPEEMAELVFYLCHSNTFMTNQTLTIAGGD